MHFVTLYDSDRKQEVSLCCERIVKVSTNPTPLSFDRFKTFVNTDDGGTVRVAEDRDEVVRLIQQAFNAQQVVNG